MFIFLNDGILANVDEFLNFEIVEKYQIYKIIKFSECSV
jgi:hypothetical protein